MVLDLKAPEGDDLPASMKVVPSFLAYVVSFVFAAIIDRQYRNEAEFQARRRAHVAKDRISTLLYILAIPAAFVSPFLSILIFATIAAIYMSPGFFVSKPK